MAERGEIEPGFYWARTACRLDVSDWEPVQVFSDGGVEIIGIESDTLRVDEFEFGPRLTPPGEPT